MRLDVDPGVVATAEFEAHVLASTGVDPDRLLGPWLRELALPSLAAAGVRTA